MVRRSGDAVSVLSAAEQRAIQHVIDERLGLLRKVSGFVTAEPGFPLVDGTFLTDPAIIVLVSHKVPPDHLLDGERPPETLGGYQVCVMQADPVRQLEAIDDAAGRQLAAAAAAATYTYEPLPGNPIDKPFTVSTPMLCHVGPDAGWPNLMNFLQATQRELAVAIYDFNAKHISTTLITTVLANKLDVVLNWDDSPRVDTEIDTVNSVRQELGNRFHDEVVKTGSGHRFANSYHEKVAVRDSAALWLSSGNWTVRSQPAIDPVKDPESGRGMYGKYNREWHVVIDDPDLAKLFETYIRYDFDQSVTEAKDEGVQAVPGATAAALPDVFVPLEDMADMAAMAAVPLPVPALRVPKDSRKVPVQPVLTPDNYVDRVTALLDGAKRSIYMQFAYITFSDAEIDARFTNMLDVLKKKTNDSDVDVRIIVGSTQAATKVRLLVQNGFNQEAFRQQANIHNKGIVVDGERVLVSSANWSGDGVLRNRDAGLIISDTGVAGYYQGVFLDDWNHRATPIRESKPAIVAAPSMRTPAGMVRVSWQDYVGD
jgi:phosphatidylserine/phosphatidylglycerophosphate/cardiolipin synthase-like enzyme